jgi:hypothetical protein
MPDNGLPANLDPRCPCPPAPDASRCCCPRRTSGTPTAVEFAAQHRELIDEVAALARETSMPTTIGAVPGLL